MSTPGWNATNWQPPNWQPPNWEAPIHTAPPVFVAVRAAFLDRFGRFVKREEDLYEIRLWADGASAGSYEVMSAAEYRALSTTDKVEIRNLGSGAGLVDTSHKSNA